MSWYVGEYGLLTHIDLDRLRDVTLALCRQLTDDELACLSTDEEGDKLHCLPAGKRDEYRAALLPLLDLTPKLRDAGNAAMRCEYEKAMTAMRACPKVPERYRRNLERAWASTAGVSSPAFWCQVGIEVMRARLTALGCDGTPR